jgi:serine/threonine protein kinase
MDRPLPIPTDSNRNQQTQWAEIYREFSWGEVVSAVGDEIVYRATFGPEAQPCLLLPLRRDSFPTPADLERFAHSMAAIQQLRAPALLNILGVGIRDGTACVCYDDFSGVPLLNLIAKRPKAAFSVKFLSAVCLGLHTAHLQGFAHLDINPAWIFVSESGEAKLIGLGITPLIYPTKRLFYEACLRRPAELRAYVAPEQLKAEAETPVSARTDVYSLGAIAYHLLTGVPLGGYVVLPSSNREVGTFTDNVVFTATLADPNARQVSAEKFGNDLCLIGGGVDNSHFSLSDPEEQQRVRQARRERQRNLTIAGVGLMGIVAAVGYSLYKPGVATGEANAPAETVGGKEKVQPNQLQSLFGKENKEEAIAIISVLMQKLVSSAWSREKTEELEEMSPIAIQLGQEGALLAKATQLLNELPSDSPDLERVGRLVSLLSEGAKNHQEALGEARKYREGGQKELARAELARAQAFLPDHPSTLNEFELLKDTCLADLTTALSQAKLPSGEPVQFAIREHRVELHVDLANNITLKDLSFLKGHPITHLDISNTDVSSLEPVANLPLHVLHLDDTRVQDLRPLRSLSLRMLTAEGNEILQKGFVTKNIFLTSYRLGLPYDKTLTKTDRVQRNRSWINHLGMRFAPLQGSTTVLFGDWETRQEDFETFANDTKLTASPGMMCRDEAGEWKSQPFSWADPPGEQTIVDPVVGVNFTEAKHFCEWLTRKAIEKDQIPKTAKFRLPTTQEWSQATGLLSGSLEEKKCAYPWGPDWPPPATAGNYPPIPIPAAKESQAAEKRQYEFTSPAGRFRNLCPHRDMGGNVREWCQGEDNKPILRDASCQVDSRDFPKLEDALKIDAETTPPADSRDSTIGFRVVLDFGKSPDAS